MKYPCQAEDFLSFHANLLTQFERVELCDFREKIYYCPQQSSDGANLDDHEGYYNVKQGDHLLYRFEVDRVLGKGSFA